MAYDLDLMAPSFSLGRMSFEQLLDKKWHHICVTWNGESGVVMQYLDGTKKQAGTGLVWEYEGGGALKMGDSTSFPYHISGLNLWDKVLTPENIKDMSASCLRGIGNVKSWLDFQDAATAKRTLKVMSPSVCTSPSQPSTDQEDEPSFRNHGNSPLRNNGSHPVGLVGMSEFGEPEYNTLSNPPPWKNRNNGKKVF